MIKISTYWKCHKNWWKIFQLTNRKFWSINIYFYKKNHQNWWHFTHWKCHQNWWKLNDLKNRKFRWINIYFFKKITKIADILLIENFTKIGEKSFTKKSENFSESIKFSVKKSPKLVTVFPTKKSSKLVKNHSPKKVKILVNHYKFL